MALSISLSTTSPKPGQQVNCHFIYTKTFSWAAMIRIKFYLDGTLIHTEDSGGPVSGTGTWDGYFTFYAPRTPGVHKLSAQAEVSSDGVNWLPGDNASITFTVLGQEVTISSWNVSVDKTAVSPGDIVTLTTTVYWEAPGSIQFKLDINAFGRQYSTNPVSVSTSPAIIKTQLKVPSDVSGSQTISVTLDAYY